MAQLPRSQREAVESAGYRVSRWSAARTILHTRVTKARIAAPLGDFLTHWLSQSSAYEPVDELNLSFAYISDQVKLTGGSMPLATSPLEHALLHLPALRSFWCQELRQHHFEALRVLVPHAWLLDAAAVPPGAVIHGLDMVSWEQLQRMPNQDGQIQDRKGLAREDWHRSLATRDSIWVARTPAGKRLNATYGPNDKDQVVLLSIEAAP